MERKRINVPTKLVVATIFSVVAYEATAVVLNKTTGAGLPYLPHQLTPENTLPAGVILGSNLAATTTVSLII